VTAHDVELLGGQPCTPFCFRKGHGKYFFLHGALSVVAGPTDRLPRSRLP
jgi:hypothetical protein